MEEIVQVYRTFIWWSQCRKRHSIFSLNFSYTFFLNGKIMHEELDVSDVNDWQIPRQCWNLEYRCQWKGTGRGNLGLVDGQLILRNCWDAAENSIKWTVINHGEAVFDDIFSRQEDGRLLGWPPQCLYLCGAPWQQKLGHAAFPPIEALVAADKKLPKGSILMVSSLLPVRQIPICKGTQQIGWGGVGLGIGG